MRATLEWNPDAWWREPWRLFTYGCVHASHAHLALNALVALAVSITPYVARFILFCFTILLLYRKIYESRFSISKSLKLAAGSIFLESFKLNLFLLNPSSYMMSINLSLLSSGGLASGARAGSAAGGDPVGGWRGGWRARRGRAAAPRARRRCLRCRVRAAHCAYR